MQALTLRPFAPSDADYVNVVELRNVAMPDYRDTVEDWRHWDETRAQAEADLLEIARRNADSIANSWLPSA